MNKSSADTAPWGNYSPTGIQKLLLLLPRAGLSHGRIKKIIAQAWSGLQTERQPVDIIYQDLKYRLHPWDNAIESKMLFASRRRDVNEINLLREHLSDGEVFIDIGANIGYYSLMAASFGAGKIIAIEPNPEMLSRLEFNISTNDFTDIIETAAVALGDHSNTTTLYLSQDDLGSSSCLEPDNNTGSIIVKMQPLAELLYEHKIESIDVMKIDIEGVEDTVLYPFYENCMKSLWPGLLIMEYSSNHLWKRDILSLLLDSGYIETGKTRSNIILRLIS